MSISADATTLVDFFNIKVGDKWKWTERSVRTERYKRTNWIIEEVIDVLANDRFITKVITGLHQGNIPTVCYYEVKLNAFNELEIWYFEDNFWTPNFKPDYSFFDHDHLMNLNTGKDQFEKLSETDYLIEMM